MHNETFPAGRVDGEALSSTPCHRPLSIKITIRPISLGSRGQNYAVFLDGGLLIASTRNPTGDACRHLVALDRSGRLEVWDDTRPYPRLIIPDITKGSTLTVAENERHGPRFVAYRALPEFTKEAA